LKTDRDYWYYGFIVRRCSGWYYVSHPSQSRVVSIEHAFRTLAEAKGFIRAVILYATTNPPPLTELPMLVESVRESIQPPLP
jgi:hypothetical protein